MHMCTGERVQRLEGDRWGLCLYESGFLFSVNVSADSGEKIILSCIIYFSLDDDFSLWGYQVF